MMATPTGGSTHRDKVGDPFTPCRRISTMCISVLLSSATVGLRPGTRVPSQERQQERLSLPRKDQQIGSGRKS